MTRALSSLGCPATLALALAVLSAAPRAQLVADFTSSVVSGSNPLTVTFTDTSTGGAPVGWIWDFGDGQASNQPSPVHTYTAPGTYDVQLTVVEGLFSSDSVTKPGLISVAPAVFDASFLVSATQGTNPFTVDFSDTSSGPVDSWTWDFGDGATSTQQHPSHTYTLSAGTTSYSVSLTTTVGSESATVLQTDLITVDPAVLIPDFSVDVTGGPHPLVVQFTDQSTGPVEERLWSFGDGTLWPNATSVSHTYYTGDQPSSFDVTLFVAVGDQVESITRPAFITAEPADMQLDFTADVGHGVGDQQVVFSNTSSGADGASWRWDFGDGGEINGLNAVHDYFVTEPTAFDVTVTATIGEQVESLTRGAAILMAPEVFGAPATAFAADPPTSFVWAQAMPDLNGDGLPDFVHSGEFEFVWYALQPDQTLASKQAVMEISWVPPLALPPELVEPVDLDGDGDLDLALWRPLLDTSDSEVLWVENTDGAGTFAAPGPAVLIDARPHYGTSVDMEGDGDLDLVFAASSSASGVWWHENLDGSGTLGPRRIVVLRGVRGGLAAGDFDGDGDGDVAVRYGNELEWHENQDGLGGAWVPHPLDNTSTFSTDGSLQLGDLDGDGDADLLSVLDDVAWHARLPGGGFGPAQLIDVSVFGDESLIADVDQDGDRDVVFGNPVELGWYENLDGAGSFGPRRRVVWNDFVTLGAVADIDGDGDAEVLASRGSPFQGLGVEWVENLTVRADWIDLGAALAGGSGSPELLGAGTLGPGELVSLALQDAPPGAVATLVLGSSALNAPFKGGVMVPHPDALLPLLVGPHGVHVQLGTWPAAVPAGLPIFAQHWVVDGGAPLGLAASNAVTGVTVD